MSDDKVYKVDLLTRVEGEGRFSLRVRGDEVVQAHLAIFEAPRFFEALLRGRSLNEAPDIVARICGICPVAYQMSCVQALERALGITIGDELRVLRRLLYCGEWIESHALHVFLLHAPDYLGYASAIEMAKDHKHLVERGLQMKKAGNAIIEVLGGRAIHPVSVRVGGFTRVPSRSQLAAIRPQLEAALSDAEETVGWLSSLAAPQAHNDYVFVCVTGRDYPLEASTGIHISGRGVYAIEEFDDLFTESHVEHSNALHCHLADGTPYLCGPMARLNLMHDRLHARAISALEDSKLALPVTNPYQSIVVRAIELVHAFAEALDIIDGYRKPATAYIEADPDRATACGATEAPRGLLYHRYSIDESGLITDAKIVPPTSQNQARIEADLVSLAPTLLTLEHEQATRRCEQLIRAYDPCISCATHFLRLDIEREAQVP